MLIGKLISY